MLLVHIKTSHCHISAQILINMSGKGNKCMKFCCSAFLSPWSFPLLLWLKMGWRLGTLGAQLSEEKSPRGEFVNKNKVLDTNMETYLEPISMHQHCCHDWVHQDNRRQMAFRKMKNVRILYVWSYFPNFEETLPLKVYLLNLSQAKRQVTFKGHHIFLLIKHWPLSLHGFKHLSTLGPEQ